MAAALRRAKAELRALPSPPSDEAGLKDFLALEQLRSRLEIECSDEARKPALCLPFMCPGRVVRVRGGGLDGDWGWGAVVGFQCRSSSFFPFRSVFPFLIFGLFSLFLFFFQSAAHLSAAGDTRFLSPFPGRSSFATKWI